MKLYRCPEDYEPNETSIKFCKSKGLTNDMIEELVFEMKDYEYKREHKDWDATFRWWIRNGIKFGTVVPPRKLKTVEEISPEQRSADILAFERDVKKFTA